MASELDPKKYMAEPGGLSLSLFNPFSQMSGDVVDRYPKFFADMFPKSPKAGYLAAKTTATALLGAAIFGGARGAKWLFDAGSDDNASDPARGMGRQVGTTFRFGGDAADFDEKRKERQRRPRKRKRKDDGGELTKEGSLPVERPAASSFTEQAVNVALPAAAIIASGLLAFKAVDSAADKAWTARTDRALKRNRSVVQRLVETRARLANGNATDAEVEKALAATADSGYVKTAGDDSRGWLARVSDWLAEKMGTAADAALETSIGDKVKNLGVAIQLLTLGAGVATGIGAYRYFSKNNVNNIRYKAYKRGLQDYARLKTEMTPLTMSPDEGMVKRISAGGEDKKKEKQVRDQPEAEETRRPMMLTLD